MARSLRASKEGLEKLKRAFSLRGWTQEYLAGGVQCSRQTVMKFFAGQAIDKRIFEAICAELQLELGEIVELELEEEQSSKFPGVDDNMAQALQENASESIQEQDSTMGVLTSPAAITEEQDKTDEERLAFAIAGSVSKIDIQKLKAIVGVLQKITGDTSLEIVDIEKG